MIAANGFAHTFAIGTSSSAIGLRAGLTVHEPVVHRKVRVLRAGTFGEYQSPSGGQYHFASRRAT